MHYAGETKALLSIMGKNLNDPLYDPAEVLETVLYQCLAYISIIAPEKIVIFSDLPQIWKNCAMPSQSTSLLYAYQNSSMSTASSAT